MILLPYRFETRTSYVVVGECLDRIERRGCVVAVSWAKVELWL